MSEWRLLTESDWSWIEFCARVYGCSVCIERIKEPRP